MNGTESVTRRRRMNERDKSTVTSAIKRTGVNVTEGIENIAGDAVRIFHGELDNCT
jgi:hypothetical protein